MIMRIKKNKILLACIAAVLVNIIEVSIVFAIINGLDNIDRVNGEYFYSVTSPDKKKEASVYLVGPNDPLSASGVLVTIYDRKKIKLRRIYYDYPKSNVKIVWKDNDTIVIDGKKMNIYKDQYDWRK